MGSFSGSGIIIRTEGKPAAQATTDAAEGAVSRKVPKVLPIWGKRGRYSLRRPGMQADTGKPLSPRNKGRGSIGCRVEAVEPHSKVYSGRTQGQGRERDYPAGCLLGLELNLIKAPAKNLNIHYLSYLSNKEPALQQVTKLAPAGSSADDLPNDRDVLKSIDLSG